MDDIYELALELCKDHIDDYKNYYEIEDIIKLKELLC